MHLLVNDQLREHQVALVKDRIVVLVIYGLVHQRMWANKVEDRVGKAWRVVHTCSGTRLGNFRVENRQPGWVWCRLLLKLSCKTKKNRKISTKKKLLSSRFPFPHILFRDIHKWTFFSLFNFNWKNCQYTWKTFMFQHGRVGRGSKKQFARAKTSLS